jgi:phage tail-like protein
MIAGLEFLNLTTASFRFVVAIDGAPTAAFTECTLPTIEWDAETVKEGGLNTFVHMLPGQRKQTTVTLKNGIGIASDLMAWYIATMNERFRRRRVTITLLNRFHLPVMVWHIENAYPQKWTGPQLQSDANTIAIQTLELACGEVIMG